MLLNCITGCYQCRIFFRISITAFKFAHHCCFYLRSYFITFNHYMQLPFILVFSKSCQHIRFNPNKNEPHGHQIHLYILIQYSIYFCKLQMTLRKFCISGKNHVLLVQTDNKLRWIYNVEVMLQDYMVDFYKPAQRLHVHSYACTIILHKGFLSGNVLKSTSFVTIT